MHGLAIPGSARVASMHTTHSDAITEERFEVKDLKEVSMQRKSVSRISMVATPMMIVCGLLVAGSSAWAADLRHSREITILCLAKVIQHHARAGALLPLGKAVCRRANHRRTGRDSNFRLADRLKRVP